MSKNKVVRFELASKVTTLRYQGLLYFEVHGETVKNIWLLFGGRSGFLADGKIVGSVRKPLLHATALTETELVWIVGEAARMHKTEEPTAEELKAALMLELHAWQAGVVGDLQASKTSTITNACLALNVPSGLAVVLRRLRLEPLVTPAFAEASLLNAQLGRSWKIATYAEGGSLPHDFVRSTNAGTGTQFLLHRAKLGVVRKAVTVDLNGVRSALG